jgi:hypothetical protein
MPIAAVDAGIKPYRFGKELPLLAGLSRCKPIFHNLRFATSVFGAGRTTNSRRLHLDSAYPVRRGAALVASELCGEQRHEVLAFPSELGERVRLVRIGAATL